ncbi:MAG TPA: aminomethyl-transferring glycine dehydrogenase subunit GcvPA [Actinomycetota bacterium]|jgi:glycine dehydrogenase subunit 1|nr:aminomethyl-transferring glycine dehydrogenase subunit GcvPA [Actinomycetota bacterium]
MRFAPHTDEDVREMLARCGLGSLDALFSQIPASVRLERPLDLPEGVSEMEVLADLRSLAARDRGTEDLVCFAGGGAYDHYVPAVVWSLAGRSEFYTSYTPYQPELSQGVLQALFEYQSMICELTGMDVSNASLYDGATALAEAVNLARSAPGRGRVLVSGAMDPRYVETLRTYGRGTGYEPEIFDVPDGRGGDPPLGPDVACLIVQHPNVYGLLEPARELFGAAHAAGARAIQVFDPLSLGVLAPPGDLRADIAVAEGQVLGNHLSFGGPYLGIIATRLDDVRRLPGRIVGETLDVDGRTGYVLTLQAREQHIRREKATSNICTNQTLMAIAATVYLAWLGPQGLAELGRQCAARAAYALDRLTRIRGVEPMFPGGECFKEFVLRLPRPASSVVEDLVARGFLAGVPLPQGDGHGLLVAVTEQRTRDQIEGLADAMGEVLR